MAGKENERNFGVEFSTGVRNAGVVIGFLGLIGMLAKIRFAGEVATAGAILATVGQGGIILMRKR